MARGSVGYAGTFLLMHHQRCALLLPIILHNSSMHHQTRLILKKGLLAGHTSILPCHRLRLRSRVASITTGRWSIHILRFRRPYSPGKRTRHNLAMRVARLPTLSPNRAMQVPLPGNRDRPIRRSNLIPGSRGLLTRRSSPTRRPTLPSLRCISAPLSAVRREVLPVVRAGAGAA